MILIHIGCLSLWQNTATFASWFHQHFCITRPLTLSLDQSDSTPLILTVNGVTLLNTAANVMSFVSRVDGSFDIIDTPRTDGLGEDNRLFLGLLSIYGMGEGG